MKNLGAERCHFEHLLVRNLVEPPRLGDDAGIGGVDAVDIRIDVAALGLDGGGERHRARVRAAAAQGGDSLGRLMHPLEAGNDRHRLVFGEAPNDAGAVDGGDPRRAMDLGGQDRHLPALPGAGVEAHFLQHEGQEAGGHLLAGGHDGVVFGRVVEGRGFLHPGDEFVRLAGHGRYDDRHIVAGLDLAFHMPGDIADPLNRGDGRAAELHDETRHKQRARQKEPDGKINFASSPGRRRRIHDGGVARCQRAKSVMTNDPAIRPAPNDRRTP